jgi:hypothetical protein
MLKMELDLTVFLSLICLLRRVSLYVQNFSVLSINMPLLVVYNTSIISLMSPMECWFLSKCAANFDLYLLNLKS